MDGCAQKIPIIPVYYFCDASAHSGLGRSCKITPTHTRLGRTALDEGSARRRDFYLTTYNTHKRKTSTPTTGFDPAIQASERAAADLCHRRRGSLDRLPIIQGVSVYRQSPYTATNCGAQSVALYRDFSVYLTELPACCMEHAVYF
jgi:hypothetical protein